MLRVRSENKLVIYAVEEIKQVTDSEMHWESAVMESEAEDLIGSI